MKDARMQLELEQKSKKLCTSRRGKNNSGQACIGWSKIDTLTDTLTNSRGGYAPPLYSLPPPPRKKCESGGQKFEVMTFFWLSRYFRWEINFLIGRTQNLFFAPLLSKTFLRPC